MEAEYRAAAAAVRRYTMACNECLKGCLANVNVIMDTGVRNALLDLADEVPVAGVLESVPPAEADARMEKSPSLLDGVKYSEERPRLRSTKTITAERM